MSNLEKLGLHLLIIHKETFIDGNKLKYNIINHLLHLKQFQFNIHSFVPVDNRNNLPSNEDIRHALTHIGNNQIMFCVNYYPESRMDGLYQIVRKTSLFDKYPFEHEFFIRISQLFPFIESLSLTNQIPQNNKQSEETNLSIVEFPHLIELNVDNSHDDYLEQFLIDKKTLLPDNILLGIEYHQSKRVTHDFTRPETRNNCEKFGYEFCYDESNVFQDI